MSEQGHNVLATNFRSVKCKIVCELQNSIKIAESPQKLALMMRDGGERERGRENILY